ncbi:BREX protein BrxB domain-containing protein [Salisaeta longa]|uniref:BREX protein BrxB domain-containing protein n=1 Tax=Salisaeta longa TaxID=503170 RepID=UPI0003B6311D|nr:BREX protein BrxB domain-containing protein [Salisaeta longa]
MTKTPLQKFKDRLGDFATGTRRGIRNPFVIVPVAPVCEQRAAQDLARWAHSDMPPTEVTTIYLDRVMAQTEVVKTLLKIPASFYDKRYDKRAPEERTAQEADTLRDNLAVEMVQCIVERYKDACRASEHIVLLLHLGALYPFARASELLDEMDRQRVQATVGIPFPGKVIGGKLSFFGERAQHYYPAHRIEERITTAHLQA